MSTTASVNFRKFHEYIAQVDFEMTYVLGLSREQSAGAIVGRMYSLLESFNAAERPAVVAVSLKADYFGP